MITSLMGFQDTIKIPCSPISICIGRVHSFMVEKHHAEQRNVVLRSHACCFFASIYLTEWRFSFYPHYFFFPILKHVSLMHTTWRIGRGFSADTHNITFLKFLHVPILLIMLFLVLTYAIRSILRYSRYRLRFGHLYNNLILFPLKY